MNEQLESRLRLALAELAAELPAGASAGVLASGYRPRTHSSRSAAVLAGLAALVGAALGISLLSLGTSTPRAFAGWTATPTASIEAHAKRAEEECRWSRQLKKYGMNSTQNSNTLSLNVFQTSLVQRISCKMSSSKYILKLTP